MKRKLFLGLQTGLPLLMLDRHNTGNSPKIEKASLSISWKSLSFLLMKNKKFIIIKTLSKQQLRVSGQVHGKYSC